MLYMAQRIFLEHTKIKMKTRISNTILIVGPESSFFDKKLEENDSRVQTRPCMDTYYRAKIMTWMTWFVKMQMMERSLCTSIIIA